MHISFEHHDKSFNICLHSSKDKEPFLVIKGCRMVEGSKGRFISFPAKKMDSGKYWNHVYASEPFMQVIMSAYEAQAPKKQERADYDDSPPF